MSILVLTLDEILFEYVEKSFILKMNCEYNILLSASNDTIKKFDVILIKFHFGCLDIEKKLESLGFKLTILNFWYMSEKTYQNHLLAE